MAVLSIRIANLECNLLLLLRLWKALPKQLEHVETRSPVVLPIRWSGIKRAIHGAIVTTHQVVPEGSGTCPLVLRRVLVVQLEFLQNLPDLAAALLPKAGPCSRIWMGTNVIDHLLCQFGVRLDRQSGCLMSDIISGSKGWGFMH